MIDKRIEDLLNTYSDSWALKRLLNFWPNAPYLGIQGPITIYTDYDALCNREHPWYQDLQVGARNFVLNCERLISTADEGDCLTSKYKYVREYKKWLNDESRN